MELLVIDIETSGLSPTENSLLSIGAVNLTTGDEFYGECRAEPGSAVDDSALAINGFTREQATDPNKLFPIGLYSNFLSWAKNQPTLIGGQQVGAFDLQFLKAIHDQGVGLPKWPFGHRSVDLHSVAVAKLGKSLSLDGILTELGLAPEPKPHNALTGARLEAEAFRRLFGMSDKLVAPTLTGLYDKHGVPICAGDRVNFTVRGYPHEKEPDHVTDAEVYYSTADACFLFGRYKYVDPKIPDGTWGYCMLDDIDPKSFEVVGKIN